MALLDFMKPNLTPFFPFCKECQERTMTQLLPQQTQPAHKGLELEDGQVLQIIRGVWHRGNAADLTRAIWRARF
jgi:hypothetical protein